MNVTGTDLEFLREWTGWFCHQLPGRSPQCAGELFPVCFRCAGLQLGVALAYFGLFCSGGWRARFPGVRTVAGWATLMLPWQVDGCGNALGWWDSPGWWRGLTGLGVGLCLPWLLAPLARPLTSAADESNSAPGDSTNPVCLRSPRFLWPALGGGAAIGVLAWGHSPVLFRLLAWAAAAAWFLLLGHYILALVRTYGAHWLPARPGSARFAEWTGSWRRPGAGPPAGARSEVNA
jgi:uncharacterized membrane protein